MPVWLRALLFWLAGLLCSTASQAHAMPQSRAWLDTTPTGLSATLQLQLPLDRLEIAYGRPLAGTGEGATLLQREGEGLARYLLMHVSARSDGLGWQVLRPRLQLQGQGAGAELIATLELKAPPGHGARSATLQLDVITHELRTHRMLVFLRNDWAAGQVGQPPVLLGELHHGQHDVVVSLSPPTPGASWRHLLLAGLRHIAEGSDHLLFLVLLLIVAPLVVQGRRWGGAGATRVALRRIAALVSAFSLGHGITLVLGSTGVLAIPAQPVEVAVAATIAVAALHAWRPLLARGEILMALGFGLIHGLAFSASLSGAGLTAWQHAQALLAFNLGIEAMQLVLLLVLLPVLTILARHRAALYARLRAGTSLAALLMAAWWISQRLGAAPVA